MKKIWSGTLALLLITGAAQAQTAPSLMNPHSQRLEQLSLTADQKAKLEALRIQQHKEWTELEKKENVTVKEAKAQKEALRKKHREQVKALLTPAQQQQLAKGRAAHFKGSKGAALAQKRTGKNLAKELNLTEGQQTKMKNLAQDFKTRRQSLQQNTSLSDSEKKEQLKALAKQHRKEVQSVLTAEQQQKLSGLRKEKEDKAGR